MRALLWCALAVLLASPVSWAQGGSATAIHDSIVQRQDARHPMWRAEEAPPRRPRTDPAQLQRDSMVLLNLAESIPDKIDQVNKGIMPKDLDEKLKEIEKLSKKLRQELNP